MTGILGPLLLTPTQNAAYHLLLSNFNDENLYVVKTDGTLDHLKKPVTTKTYATVPYPVSYYSTLDIKRGTRQPYANELSLWGSINENASGFVRLYTLPFIAENSQAVLQFMASHYNPGLYKINAVEIYNNGKRFVIESTVITPSKPHSTSQYFFLGQFDGLMTRQTYFLYGTNEMYSQRPVSTRVPQGKPALGWNKGS
jgi:hypothetical protein